MEVDQSLRSRHINYMNRPHQNDFSGKRPPSALNQQRKAQRTFHIIAESNPTDEDYSEPTDVYYYILMSSALPYSEVRWESGNILKFLVDTGSSKSYLQPHLARKKFENETPFFAKSVGGDVKITEFTFVKLFNL